MAPKIRISLHNPAGLSPAEFPPKSEIRRQSGDDAFEDEAARLLVAAESAGERDKTPDAREQAEWPASRLDRIRRCDLGRLVPAARMVGPNASIVEFHDQATILLRRAEPRPVAEQVREAKRPWIEGKLEGYDVRTEKVGDANKLDEPIVDAVRRPLHGEGALAHKLAIAVAYASSRADIYGPSSLHPDGEQKQEREGDDQPCEQEHRRPISAHNVECEERRRNDRK
ncbi:hypothetical protein FM996_04360 [Methylosinus sporium]|uniref:Uncharacterized protein n=1 Tax=Methylosinus sporium TaxID=428 RepID=A0A549T4G6_METSR|nr:hypothetical protein [Methylosinus sporium]TRL36680.1 hypothetical protein FM996_04360 [Methylosinus sporium]